MRSYEITKTNEYTPRVPPVSRTTPKQPSEEDQTEHRRNSTPKHTTRHTGNNLDTTA